MMMMEVHMSKKIFSKPSFIYAIKYSNPNLEGDSDSKIIHGLKEKIKTNQLVYDKRKSLYKIGKSVDPFNRFRLIKKDVNHPKKIYFSHIFDVSKNDNINKIDADCNNVLKIYEAYGEWVYGIPEEIISVLKKTLSTYTLSNTYEINSKADALCVKNKIKNQREIWKEEQVDLKYQQELRIHQLEKENRELKEKLNQIENDDTWNHNWGMH